MSHWAKTVSLSLFFEQIHMDQKYLPILFPKTSNRRSGYGAQKGVLRALKGEEWLMP